MSVLETPLKAEETPLPGTVLDYLHDFVKPIFDAPYLWKGPDRVMLVYRRTFTTCCGELIRCLPEATVAPVFERIGFEAGIRSADFIRGKTQSATREDQFQECLVYSDRCGFTSFDLIALQADAGNENFHALVRMSSSIEADGYLMRETGNPNRRVCAMQAGYLSGVASRLFERIIRFQETCCRGERAEQCELEGTPAGASVWEDDFGTSFKPAPAVDNGALQEIVGDSPALKTLRLRVIRVAPSRLPILVQGETGVGKELVARGLHRLSNRSRKPLLSLNCASLPESLVDAELFGVEKGAFTGAERSRAGKFERADGGTLFLDEVGLLSPAVQAKLLRVLEDGTFDRLGGETKQVDVRIVAATNTDLAAAVESGQFRRDLYYRICAVILRVPPLRERKEDILPLAGHFLALLESELGRHWSGMTGGVKQLLLTYDYPGNVRELKQIVTSAATFAEEGKPIDVAAFSAGDVRIDFRRSSNAEGDGGQQARTSANLASEVLASGATLNDLERACIEGALKRTQGNLAQAARLLGISRRQLEYRVRGK